MELFKLLGKKKEEAIQTLESQGKKYFILSTRAPRKTFADVEERVIRVLDENEEVEVLTSFFRLPTK